MKQTFLLLLTLCVTVTGCATTPTADDYFEAGDLGAALEAYETAGTPHSIYQMAMIYLDQEWFNPQRAVDLLTQLSIEHPESAYSRIGALWLSNWQERDRLASELEIRLETISTLERQSNDLRTELEESQSSASKSSGTIRSLNQQIEELKEEIATLTGRLEIRERELEELMQIDLDSEPLDTSTTPGN